MPAEITCPECGESYDSRGFRGHLRLSSCEVDTESVDFSDSTAPDENQSEEQTDVPTLEVDPDSKPVKCPECDGTDLAGANNVATILDDRGFPSEKVEAVRSESHWCNDCHLAFSESDL